jgi:hypothetical protein
MVHVLREFGIIEGRVISDYGGIGFGKYDRLIGPLVIEFLDVFNVIPTDAKNPHNGFIY